MTRLSPHRPSNSAVVALVALFCVTLAACGGARAPRPEFQMGAESAIARARADSIRYPYTKADIDFMSGMIHHHAQAIVMSKWAIDQSHGARADIQRLAERIINAQQDEIALMQAWLQDRLQPVPEPNAAGMTMNHGGETHTMLMPGMLSAEQMAELDAARGEEFDQIFLSYMIQHHRGAVSMVDELFSHRGAGQDESVFKFASDVQVDQSTEIRRMLQMLIESPHSSSQGSR